MTTHEVVLPLFSPLPHRYRTICVDPPWNYKQHWGRKEVWASDGRMFLKRGTERGAATQYDCLSDQEIAAIPVGEWSDFDAHLYVWTTNAFMVEAHNLAKGWGFEPKTILTWIKPRLGMGYYYRNTTEHVVFAVKGSLKALRHDLRTNFSGEQGKHSEKPAAFYDMVESMSPGPYLDVFARVHRFNWDAWGNEVYTPEGLPEPSR